MKIDTERTDALALVAESQAERFQLERITQLCKDFEFKAEHSIPLFSDPPKLVLYLKKKYE